MSLVLLDGGDGLRLLLLLLGLLLLLAALSGLVGLPLHLLRSSGDAEAVLDRLDVVAVVVEEHLDEPVSEDGVGRVEGRLGLHRAGERHQCRGGVALELDLEKIRQNILSDLSLTDRDHFMISMARDQTLGRKSF